MAGRPKRRARAGTPPLDTQFSPDFQELLDLCRKEIKKPSKQSGIRSTWARIMLDVVRTAREDLQRQLQTGSRPITLHAGLRPPDKPRPA
jgi:hypothetical protein